MDHYYLLLLSVIINHHYILSFLTFCFPVNLGATSNDNRCQHVAPGFGPWLLNHHQIQWRPVLRKHFKECVTLPRPSGHPQTAQLAPARADWSAPNAAAALCGPPLCHTTVSTSWRLAADRREAPGNGDGKLGHSMPRSGKYFWRTKQCFTFSR